MPSKLQKIKVRPVGKIAKKQHGEGYRNKLAYYRSNGAWVTSDGRRASIYDGRKDRRRHAKSKAKSKAYMNRTDKIFTARGKVISQHKKGKSKTRRKLSRFGRKIKSKTKRKKKKSK